MRKIIPLLLLILSLSSCTVKEPKIVLTPGVDTVSQYSEYTPQTCILKTEDETYSMKITTDNVDTTIEGTYTIIYTYTFKEVEYSCQRKVFVTDDTPPEVNLIQGVDTIIQNNEWVDMSVEYSDLNSSSLSLSVDNTVDTSKLGTYIVTYTVTDENGNEGFAHRYVNIVEK
jgi:hypothetical protein